MRILLLLIMLVASNTYATSIHITASSEPIANIIRLISKNSHIDVIATSGACPHEYILKPSDFSKTQNSDFVIYISDDFEPFIKPITQKSNATVINLSRELNIQPTHNMHIWMSLKNVQQIIKIISHTLNLPDDQAMKQVTELNIYKKTQLSGLKSVLLLSDSLEYLFEDMHNIKIEKLYINTNMTSAKDIAFLKKQNPDQCILINDRNNIEAIASQIKHDVAGIASEQWSLEGYKKMIDNIRDKCIKN